MNSLPGMKQLSQPAGMGRTVHAPRPHSVRVRQRTAASVACAVISSSHAAQRCDFMPISCVR